MFRIVLLTPEIPQNTGAIIRLAANTGAALHLVEPLGFSLDARHVRRAGLDYHELADVRVHRDLDAAWAELLPARVHAFTTTGANHHTEVGYEPGDVLLFGRESTGLPADVQDSPQVTHRVRLPMVPGSRSLNLANAVSVAVYEAWRHHGFAGARQPL
ncbi:MAG: tRNA (cytidine(34)-2'-O)-methyltransferase [Pseudonocardiaceae bacterium]|nr:MAG: tRNA (cytidine(34)-2'-O)-methyltransferase [Pseudonocardiaceae bacterium]